MNWSLKRPVRRRDSRGCAGIAECGALDRQISPIAVRHAVLACERLIALVRVQFRLRIAAAFANLRVAGSAFGMGVA